ncbi:RNase E specificity factor CsrD [Photobacterium sp. GB-27]|uniref:RNase E specificity factor CsrD n=1 Tax=unclassified Photobacterium TaxID=2628852 RepID=UPI000D16CABD|nr:MULTISPECIES: RNase E specificity factor CsrD [unclassified Photobacterium]PSV31642.1 RNase E specificity factor CsrD [Photobacterium sp. GB-72]PSV37595.1 RNase E specificity factor CsrD [Photobacterium sp. GB-27]PSV38995.1 RNase E specificity factor CsrD [Photobacterium sp. GB-210]PSV45534.1 RNase E specificity factor CsrD [Photobacterium sp. GB-36]PSW73910.1 RNase E specificity factor CsrD [Photobacterium sp. GB-50]
MRKASGMKLTNRLVAFVTMIVICAIFVIFIGGALSFRKLGQDYLTHYLNGVVQVIDQELADPQGGASLSRWLPKLLKSSNVMGLTVTSPHGVVYAYKSMESITDPNILYDSEYQLQLNPQYKVTIESIPPYAESTYSLGAMSFISLAIGIVIFGLVQGVRWLKLQLRGSELLETRGRMILAGKVDDYAVGDDHEWPGTASLAMDQLIKELKDARQGRSRFDTFIRTHTFLDQLTGAANRILFDSRLKSMLQEPDNQGSVILLRLADWDDVVSEEGKLIADEFIQDVSIILSNFIQRFPDTMLSRYYDAEFAILIPQQSAKEIKLFINQLLNALERLSPPLSMERDNWCHIGVTDFEGGERRGRIMDEADIALRSSQLQGSNSWNRFTKESHYEDDRGSVRWRTLFDRILTHGGPLLYQQPIFNAENNIVISREILARIQDEHRKLIKASFFMPIVNQVGFNQRFDRAVINQIFTLLKRELTPEVYSINISAYSLLDKSFTKWLFNELLQLPRPLLSHVIFEISESQLVKNLDALRPVLKKLVGLGCKLAVDQAGRTIVSTHYVKEVKVNYLKLHRGLVRDINKRQENQLFVRSMLGACDDSNVQIIAVGVETDKEWEILKQLGVSAGQGRLFAKEDVIL